MFLAIAFVAFLNQSAFDIHAGFFRLTFFCLAVLMVPSLKLRPDIFWRIAGFLSLFFSISVILQFILFKLGHIAPLKLPLPTYELDTLEIITHVFRSGGWFREPSYFALFLTPILIYQSRHNMWRPFALNSLAGMISTSSLIFAAFAIIFLEHLLSPRIKPVGKALATLVCIALVISILAFKDITLFSRFTEILGGGGSSIERISPFFTFFDHIFSLVPDPDRTQQLLLSSLSGDVWLSSMTYALTLLGALGVISFLLGLSYLGLTMYILFVALLFSTSILSTAYSIYLAIGLYLSRPAIRHTAMRLHSA